jgi:hypothetical protein
MKINALDLPQPSPSTPFLILHTTEVGGNSYVEYDAWGGNERVRVEFKRLIAARMDSGCEAAAAPASTGEFLDSQWLASRVATQLANYPADPDTLEGIRHLFVKGHDTVVEVLAAGYTWAVVRNAK